MGFLNRALSAVRHEDDDPSAALFASPRSVASPQGCHFYHTMDLPEFGLQDGEWDIRGRFLDYVGGVDLSDKRVLDVGSASGFLSFEAERHGAREVVSFDLDTARRQHLMPFAGSDYVVDYPKWCQQQTEGFHWWHNAYWLTHRLLNSKARTCYGDVYNPPAALGMFDVVIVGAILEHLIDPLSALFALSRHASDLLVINTDYFDTPGRVALFNGRADLPHANYVFWTYSIALYDEYMQIMGFRPLAHRKDRFSGGRPHPDAERTIVDRVALVYQRDHGRNPVPHQIAERRPA